MPSFIDSHCHAFNLVDIPMYLTLADKVKTSTIGKLKAAAGALIYLPKLMVNKDLLKNKLEVYKEFILFFERSLISNVELMLEEIFENIKENHDMENDTEILITPLVMDFDILLEQEMPAQVGREPSVREQYRRLKEAIEEMDKKYSKMRVCPFIGFDLRKLLKLDKDRLEGFKAFWKNENTLGESNIKALKTGKLLGIKLYPPIGFNPCPKKLHDKYKEFYEWCCKEDVPITAHCQTGSYAAGKEKRNLDKNTTPENWKRLLKIDDFKNLRINFAHFGGETGTDDMFEPFRIDEDSWTFILIGLLKKYPNTYADISAYDYAKKEHRKNLVKIFEKDVNGYFDKKIGGPYKLVDKLLWGSDVPMVISGKSYREGYKEKGEPKYKHYFQGFLNTIDSSDKLTPQQQKQIITNMTEVNPKKFLRLK